MLSGNIPLDRDYNTVKKFKEVLKKDVKATAKQLKKAAGLELEVNDMTVSPEEDGYTPLVLSVLDKIVFNRKNENFMKALDEWLIESGVLGTSGADLHAVYFGGVCHGITPSSSIPAHFDDKHVACGDAGDSGQG